MNRDAPLVLASLRKSTADLVVAARLPVAIKLHDALLVKLGTKLDGQNLARLSSALTNAMFGAESLDLSLKYVHAHPEAVRTFLPILEVITAAELRRVLIALRHDPPPAVRAILLRFVERSMQGQESEVAAAAAGLHADLVFAILAVLAKANTGESRQALLLMSQSEDVNVRVEAKVLAAGEAAHNEITAMCDNAQPLVRMAAVRAARRHQIRNAWGGVSRQIKDPAFNERGADERREFLRALVSLSPERGEPIALEIAKKGGVFTSGSREETRVAAAEALGELSSSAQVASALRELAQARWGTSEETRSAAQTAADLITQRLAGGGAGASGAGSAMGSASPAGAPS